MPVEELRVDLEPEEQSPEMQAKKRVLSKVLQGNWNTFIKGEGIEFAGFREYTFEDDASQIDWKASLRTDTTLVKEYEEYKTLNVYIMLDVSDTMLFSSSEKLKAERAAELAFSMCDAIQKAGDAVGFGMFNNELINNIPPGVGPGLTPRLKKLLKNPENYGGPSGLKDVLAYVNESAQQPALFIVMSDFIDLEEGWERYLTMLAQKMDVMGIMIRDPRDETFPITGGQFTLEHPSEDESMLIDTNSVREEYEKFVEEEEQRVRNTFSKNNAGLVRLNTGEDMYQPLLDFFYNRMRVMQKG